MKDLVFSFYTNLKDYDEPEVDAINEVMEDGIYSNNPKWRDTPVERDIETDTVSGSQKQTRSKYISTNALKLADFKCEADPEGHTSFLRKNGIRYTEPHHLIPLLKWKDFEYSLDIEQNIVSLFSECHNLLHYGRFEDKLMILHDFYVQRVEALAKAGIHITLDLLVEYYR